MTITCEHCAKPIERGSGLELREGVGSKHPSRTDGTLDAEFCTILCLTGWAKALANKYGFEARIPPASPGRPRQ